VREEAAGNQPTALAAADFDGDGFADLAVANQGPDNVTFQRGGASGLVRVREEAAGPGPIKLAPADFDADGFTDLAVTNPGSDLVTFLRGGASGLVRVRDERAGDFPTAVAAADFDADGFPDLAVANQGTEDNRDPDSVTYLRGGSTGLVRAGEVPAGDVPTALAAADFDADGFPDLAVANRDSDNITYLRGGSNGLVRGSSDAMKTGREVPAGDSPTALAAADFDADGFSDLAVANRDSDNVTYLRGGSDGLVCGASDGMKTGCEVPAGDSPTALAAADFDADAFPDLAVANEFSDSITYLRGGPRGLVRVRDEAAGDRPIALAAADFDADGFADLAVANQDSGNITYLRGGLAGLVRVREEPQQTDISPFALAVADFDADGFTDLAAAIVFSDTVTFFRGGGAGLVRARSEETGVFPRALAVADFDGDGFSDLVVANGMSGSVTYFRQLFLRPHLNLVFDPSAPGALPAVLLEPRVPPDHELGVPAGALSGPTQICILPAPLELSPALRREAASRSRAVVFLTRVASLLPATTMLAAPARLKLRVREGAEDLVALGLAEPARLRLFRADPASGEVRDVALDSAMIGPTEFGRGRNLVQGLAFNIQCFGVYVVAVEVDR
jgi:hypothetical protein